MLLTIAAAWSLAQSLELERIEVEFQAAARTVINLEEVIPREQAELVRLLGLAAPGMEPGLQHRIRQLARAELARQGTAASLALAWGEHHRDREIALACWALRQRLYLCGHCGGSGVCPACHGGETPDAPIEDDDGGSFVPAHGGCPEHCERVTGPYSTRWRKCVACNGTGDVRCRWKWDADAGGDIIAEVDLFDDVHLDPPASVARPRSVLADVLP